MRPQEQAFRRGVDVIVATPGRLLDHMRSSYAALRGVEVLVIDEADRMLDMGFLPDVRRILKQLPARRQTMLFSATMPPPIQALAREMLTNPVTIALGRPVDPGAPDHPGGLPRAGRAQVRAARRAGALRRRSGA